jgi:hypothetical protein
MRAVAERTADGDEDALGDIEVDWERIAKASPPQKVSPKQWQR